MRVVPPHSFAMVVVVVVCPQTFPYVRHSRIRADRGRRFKGQLICFSVHSLHGEMMSLATPNRVSWYKCSLLDYLKKRQRDNFTNAMHAGINGYRALNHHIAVISILEQEQRVVDWRQYEN